MAEQETHKDNSGDQRESFHILLFSVLSFDGRPNGERYWMSTIECCLAVVDILFIFVCSIPYVESV